MDEKDNIRLINKMLERHECKHKRSPKEVMEICNKLYERGRKKYQPKKEVIKDQVSGKRNAGKGQIGGKMKSRKFDNYGKVLLFSVRHVCIITRC